MGVLNIQIENHPVWNAVVSICGIAYFIAWSYSFYPQLILNYKRKRTTGLSPDFIYLNPLGFLALTIWSWGAYFSPIAREQYSNRHDGHLPQISKSDLAFSLHAFIISLVTLFQVWWYAQNSLISKNPTKPSLLIQIVLGILILTPIISAILVWLGKYEFLDWLYLISSIKLIISPLKYIPQVILNWKLRSVEGFAIGQIICDMIGSTLSFAQLVISSIFIDGDPGGIVANPAKLGLSFLSFAFDSVFIIQKYWFFRNEGKEDEREGGPGDEEEH
uniref:Cystinosin n=1 Tax=Kwoniella pini CBS 10737 TaxID=1296096 RepID=A0A1B9I246_9TREE|nr:uncharacterized protein I206_04148 [Kwoniella pini CBS 10737]OCF49626.1 hypothetical protein I206_04148 [Kwoniella pini CBS 10737]